MPSASAMTTAVDNINRGEDTPLPGTEESYAWKLAIRERIIPMHAIGSDYRSQLEALEKAYLEKEKEFFARFPHYANWALV